MRYPKGAIVLSDALDVPALRKVYQSGHATAWQLYRALNPVYDESKWKSFVRRVGILSERRFLIRLVVDGMAAPIFALGDEGARSLMISVLRENAPARRFYEHLGGEAEPPRQEPGPGGQLLYEIPTEETETMCGTMSSFLNCN